MAHNCVTYLLGGMARAEAENIQLRTQFEAENTLLKTELLSLTQAFHSLNASLNTMDGFDEYRLLQEERRNQKLITRVPSGKKMDLQRLFCKDLTLTVIDLYGSNIGTEGAIAITRALQKNTALRMLGLGSNGIGLDGVRHLADVLETNTLLSSFRYLVVFI